MKVLVFFALILFASSSNGQQLKLPCPLAKGIIYKHDKYEADPGLTLQFAATIVSNDTLVRAAFNGVVVYVDSTTHQIQIKNTSYDVSYFVKTAFVRAGQQIRVGQVVGISRPKLLPVWTQYKQKPIPPWQVFKCICMEVGP